MKRLATIILSLLAAAPWLAALGLGWLWWKRVMLPYNEEGRYFDEATSTVLHEQAVTIYGVLALVALALAVVVTYWIRLRRGR